MPAARSRRLAQLMTIALMLAFFAQLTFGARHLSMTADEPPYLVNGYMLLTSGDAWTTVTIGYPPLLNIWTAWPILLQPERPDPRTVRAWNEDYTEFVRAMSLLLGPIERLEFIARLPIMLLAVALMALVFRWACDWFGHWGGVLAVAAMAWDPNMIAHSQISTTDLGTTLLAFACLYLLNRLLLCRRGARRLSVWIGLMTGATMAAKASGLILVPIVAAMMGWGYLGETGARWRALLCKRFRQTDSSVHAPVLLPAACRWLGYAVLALVTGILFLWCTYRFEWRALPGMSWPLPLASYLRMSQILFEGRNRIAFLWGELGSSGWWWYFPFALAIKTPIPLAVAFIASLITALARPRRSFWNEAVLWFFPIAYMAVSIQGGMNIGYRHVLPIFPFVYVSIGRLAQTLFDDRSVPWRRVAQWAAIMLGAWYIIGTLSVYPFALAYFNELVGGPRNGYHYLVDSNVEWGQSFKALKAYMDQSGTDKVRLSYYTYVDPAVYGLNYEPLYPAPGTLPALYGRFDPAPGAYAISATTLQGIMQFPDLYDWFRHQTPTAQPGYGMLVYQVPARESRGKWIAQCASPGVPLNTENIEEGFDRQDLRQIRFDCATSWIYPAAGQSPGWYGFHRDVWLHRDNFMSQHLAPTRLAYQQGQYFDEPPFVLLEWTGTNVPSPSWQDTPFRINPGDGAPLRAESQVPARVGPVRLNGPLTFLGYRLSSTTTQRMELATVWRAEAGPKRPLTLTARMVSANGEPIASSDGLGVPIDQWRPGDILVQRHILNPSGDRQGPYWFQIGVDWLDTHEKWQAIEDGNAIGDQILVGPVKNERTH